MSFIVCTRCHKWFSEEEMFNLGFKNDESEPVFSCEGCLISVEQDHFYGQFSILQANPA